MTKTPQEATIPHLCHLPRSIFSQQQKDCRHRHEFLLFPAGLTGAGDGLKLEMQS
jgi:hypothetical protein